LGPEASGASRSTKVPGRGFAHIDGKLSPNPNELGCIRRQLSYPANMGF